MSESITTSYPRRAAWTLRATQVVMRRFDDVRFSGECYTRGEFNHLQDIIAWLNARDDRIMAECLALESPDCDDPGAHRPGCQCDGGEPLL